MGITMLVAQEVLKEMERMTITTKNTPDFFWYLTGSEWRDVNLYQMEYGIEYGNGLDRGYGAGYGDGFGYNDSGVDEGAMTGCGDCYGYVFNWV